MSEKCRTCQCRFFKNRAMNDITPCKLLKIYFTQALFVRFSTLNISDIEQKIVKQMLHANLKSSSRGKGHYFLYAEEIFDRCMKTYQNSN